MRLVLQRVSRAGVEVDGTRVAAIGTGLLVLVAVLDGDDEDNVERAARKLAELRVFEDASGRMNRSISEVGGEVLLVSQFTLAASLARGRRPSFDAAAEPTTARRLCGLLEVRLRDRGVPVQSGRFGARMRVDLVNEGPVTFVLDL